jgi:outer membrane protein
MKYTSPQCLLAAVWPLRLRACTRPGVSAVGFVNTDRIFKEANTAKAAQSKLEQEFSKREKELVDLGQQPSRRRPTSFERDAPTLSEASATRQKQLVDQDRDFQRKRREFQEDLNARKNEELQQVLERANRVVKQVAEAEKYDLVLQEAVYINPKHDITDKVIKALNAGPSSRAGWLRGCAAPDLVERWGANCTATPTIADRTAGAAGVAGRAN